MRPQTADWALTHAARATPSKALKIAPQKVPVPRDPNNFSVHLYGPPVASKVCDTGECAERYSNCPSDKNIVLNVPA